MAGVALTYIGIDDALPQRIGNPEAEADTGAFVLAAGESGAVAEALHDLLTPNQCAGGCFGQK